MKQEKNNPIAEVFAYATDKKKVAFSVLLAIISVFGGLVHYFSSANLAILIIRQNLVVENILKDAPIILLDETTSSVAPENEWLLQQAIHELVKRKTVIMIAHKMKTIMNADQIVVMDKGSIHGWAHMKNY